MDLWGYRSYLRSKLGTQKPLHSGGELLPVPNIALPNHKHLPTKFAEFVSVLFVPLLVPRQLRPPVRRTALWDVRVNAAWVLVPKAPPYLNDSL
jgi:hypothetical protein